MKFDAVRAWALTNASNLIQRGKNVAIYADKEHVRMECPETETRVAEAFVEDDGGEYTQMFDLIREAWKT